MAGIIFLLLGIIIVPLPPGVLDLFLSLSIGGSLVLFLATLFVKRPVDLSVFPTLLLGATMYRLALNIASTRLILLHGEQGDAAAGQVIRTFGEFVVGGSYVVGLVIFCILVLINFIVITKGAGRVAEVAARFTLDAMPGKQMAIDAELNAGMIDEETARTRRAMITQEADFYGSMDGASKFVRGDAIAGVLITVVNILGGVILGTTQKGMALGDAVQTYTVLTIGDGLVGQVPALITSLAAGILVTRVQDGEAKDLQAQLSAQLFSNPRLWWIATAGLGFVALLPGFHVSFGILTIGAGLIARAIPQPGTPRADVPQDAEKSKDTAPEDLLPIEPLCIELGVDLIYLVDDKHGGELVQRIQRVRSQFATDLGVVLPAVHLRDNLKLDGGDYQVLLRGEKIGNGTLRPRRHLALDPGTATAPIKGVKGEDPVFGLPARWIGDGKVLKAQALGYTVVDVPTILTTHLVELMQEHAHALFDSRQLDALLERMTQRSPRQVDDLIPDIISRTDLLRVMRNLIREGISVRDFETILEAVAQHAPRIKHPDVLTEFVRQSLSRHITHRYTDSDGAVHVVTLSNRAEQTVLRGLTHPPDGAPQLDLAPQQLRELLVSVRELTERYEGAGQAVLLTPPLARGAMRRLLERVLPRAVVLSSAELLPSSRLEPAGVIDFSDAA